MTSCGLTGAEEPPETLPEEAYVTLATNDTYAFGAVVLAYSLRDVKTTKKLVVLITRDVGPVMKHILALVFDDLQQVTLFSGKDPLGYPDRESDNIRVSFTKLHCWRLTGLTKAVFLDADTLVLSNCDELFDRRELSAAPLKSWPDLFDTGVFVFTPSQKTYGLIMKLARDKASFDGVDRGILNDFFGREWRSDLSLRLPFVYNLQATSDSPFFTKAYMRFGASNTKIVHFCGSHKPWTQFYDWTTGIVQPTPGCPHRDEHLQKWWDVFAAHVQPKLARHPCGEGSKKPGLVCREEICQPSGSLQSEEKTLESTDDSQIGSTSTKQATTVPPSASSGKPSIDNLLSILSDTSVANIFQGATPSAERESCDRFEAWERGEVDYMGLDAFVNIQSKLDASIKALSTPKVATPRQSMSESDFCEMFAKF